jgi:chromosome partitioning protein
MKEIDLPYIIVVGNEKGGAGKTTVSMHLICGLLERGLSVSSIDVDCRQHSLTSYIENRKLYKEKYNESGIQVPNHVLIINSEEDNIENRNTAEKELFEHTLQNLQKTSDVIVIDTPGSNTFLSFLAHSYADKVITPINDSFIDLDVIATIDESGKVLGPSIYAQMLSEIKSQRAKRDNYSIEWVIARNRLSALDAKNKRRVQESLSELEGSIGFKIIPGFNERVIFKELFLHGLTLFDLSKVNYHKPFSLSHVAARQELRDFLSAIGIESIVKAKHSAKVIS